MIDRQTGNLYLSSYYGHNYDTTIGIAPLVIHTVGYATRTYGK
jgi:hypothetical protein